MEVERSQSLDRFITFVDAIVAIAITLLVLPLGELAGQLHDGDSVATLLRAHDSQFGSFLLSFAVIARFWFVQHRLLRDVAELTQAATIVLVAWTLTIVFLPFPTALLAPAGEQALTKTLYIGTLALSAALLALLAYVIGQDPARTTPGPRVAAAAVNAALFALALVLSLVIPHASYYPLLILFFSDAVLRGWYRVRGEGAGGTSTGAPPRR